MNVNGSYEQAVVEFALDEEADGKAPLKGNTTDGNDKDVSAL